MSRPSVKLHLSPLDRVASKQINGSSVPSSVGCSLYVIIGFMTLSHHRAPRALREVKVPVRSTARVSRLAASAVAWAALLSGRDTTLQTAGVW
jgi:hypothetical protein